MKYFHFLELLALVTGLATLKVARPSFLQMIVLLLGITVFNELVIIQYLKSTHLFSRNIAYNIFSLLDMAIWFAIFYKIHRIYNRRRWIVFASIVCFIYSIAELSFLKDWKQLHVDSFRLYNMVIVTLSVVYFYDVMKKEYHNILLDQIFWICSATFLFHLIFFINLTTISENNYWKLKNANAVFYILHNIANTCYYLLLCTAFVVCFYKNRLNRLKSSQSLLQ